MPQSPQIDEKKAAFYAKYEEAKRKRAFYEKWAAAKRGEDQDTSRFGTAGYSFRGAAKDVIGGAMSAAGGFARMSGEMGKKLGEVSPLLDPVGAVFPGARGRFGTALEERAPNSGQEGFVPDVARGVGSSLFFLGAAAPLAVAGAPAVASMAGIAYLGAVTNGGQEFYTQLAADPEDTEKAWRAFGMGAAIGGPTEAFPLGRILNRINKATGGSLLKTMLREMGTESFEEFLAEGTQSLTTDIIAANLREDELPLFEAIAKTVQDPEALKRAARAGAVGAAAVIPLSGGATFAQAVVHSRASQEAQAGTGADKAPEAAAEPEAAGKPSPILPDPDTVEVGEDFDATPIVEQVPEPVGESSPEPSLEPEIDAQAPIEGEVAPAPTPEEIAAEGETIEDEGVRRFVEGQREAGFVGPLEVVAPESVEGAAEDAEIIKDRGVRIEYVQGEGALPLPAMYRQDRIIMDARQDPQTRRKALLVHELAHHFRATFKGEGKPERIQGLIDSLEAIAPGWLKESGETYQKRYGKPLDPEALEDESVAFLFEQAPGAILKALEDPARMREIAQRNPGVLRRIVDWILEWAAKRGMGQSPAMKRLEEVAGPLEAEAQGEERSFAVTLGPERLARVGLAAADAFNALSGRGEGAAAPLEAGAVGAKRQQSPVSADVSSETAAPAPPLEGERFAVAPPTDSAEFSDWFQDSKVVDGEGRPLVVYHGTTHEFSAFNPDAGNLENHFGRAIYLTDSPEDVGENYAGEGPDLTSRLEQRSERIAGENDWEYDDPRAKAQARAELVGGGARVMPVYAALTNPLDLRKPPYWEMAFDEETEEESGELLEFWESLQRAAGPFDEVDIAQLQDDVLNQMEGDAAALIEAARSSEGLAYATDENGDLASSEILRRAIEGMGYDGIIMDAGTAFGVARGVGKPMEDVEGTSHYIAFTPTQIKSATGNTGAFSATDPDIRFAAEGEPTSDPTIPTQTPFQRSVQVRQNTMEPFWRAWKATAIEGFKTIHGRATRYMDSAVAQHAKFKAKYLDPFRKYATKNLPTKERVENLQKYIYARHAQERNAKITADRLREGRTETFPGSGMSDLVALHTVNELEGGKYGKHYIKLGEMWDETNSAHLDKLVEYGLETQEYVDHLREIFPHYAPLKTLADETERASMGIGKGADIRGREFKRARGRESMADVEAIFAHASEAYLRTFIRGEKAKASRPMLKILRDNKEALKDFATFRKPRRVTIKRGVDGEKHAVYDNTEPDSPNIVGLKEDGVEYRVEFNENYAEFAEALHVLTAEQVEGITRLVGNATRFLAAMNTRWNPPFLISNAIRDVANAFITSNEHGLAFAAQVAKDIPEAFAVVLGRKKSGRMFDMLQDFQDDGVMMAFMGLDDIHGRVREVAADLSGVEEMTKPSKKLKRALKRAVELQEIASDAVENMSRFSVYVNARLMLGMSRDQAADYAKDITTNFRRKGLRGSHMNSWWMFSNAGIQGTVRVAQAMKSRNVQKMVGGLVVASAVLDIFNRAMSDEDDDGERYYDAIPDYIKRNNIVFMLDGANYATIPAPFVFNWFHTLGTNLGAMGWSAATGEKVQTAGGFFGDMAVAAVDSFNPLGGTDQPLTLVLPTVLDPLAEIGTNVDFAGRSIAKEPFPGQTAPRSQQYWPSVNPTARKVSEWINTHTGGDEFKGGVIDVNPEHLEYLGKTISGGAGATAGRMFNWVDKALAGEDVEIRDIPLVRRVLKQPSPYALNSRYKEAVADVGIAVKRKEAGKDLSPEDQALYRLRARVKGAERMVKARRERLSRAKTKEARDRFEQQIREIQARLNRSVEAARQK